MGKWEIETICGGFPPGMILQTVTPRSGDIFNRLIMKITQTHNANIEDGVDEEANWTMTSWHEEINTAKEEEEIFKL